MSYFSIYSGAWKCVGRLHKNNPEPHQFYLKMGNENPNKYDRNNNNNNSSYPYCYYKSEVAKITSAVISQRPKLIVFLQIDS